MYLNNIPQVNNPTDPTIIPFEERLRALAKGQKRVAYYYDIPDGTFRYRVTNMIQVLNESPNGVSSAFFHQDEPDPWGKVVDMADVLVICRARYNDQLNRIITRARNKGKVIFYDIDDLIFNVTYLHLILDSVDQDYYKSEVLDGYFGWAGRLGAALSLCDRGIATNEYLATQMQAYAKIPVSVIPNFLNQDQMEISARIVREKRIHGFARNNQIHLGYFSGTNSHNKDFEIVSDSIEKLMEKDPRIILRIVGPLVIQGRLQNFNKRIEQYPLQDFINLQRLMGEVEINLIPLRDNVFTNCKSELKYFEAGIAGSTSVASPTFAYARAIRDGENGFLAKSFEWLEKLETIVKDMEICHITAEKAVNDSIEKYAWYNYINLVEKTLFLENPEPMPGETEFKGDITQRLFSESKYISHKKTTPSKILSLIVPLYNSKPEYIDEILNRLYKFREYIQVIFINDSPDDLTLRDFINRQVERNGDFIQYLSNEKNEGIYKSYYKGFLNCHTEFCGILDHDDILDLDPIIPYLENINNFDLLYTNEYKFDENGNVELYSKPDFDVLSAPFYYYPHHITIYRTNIVKEILDNKETFPYRSIFDIDLFLNYLSKIKNIRVVHIEDFAYGWRMHENSTASNLNQKPMGSVERLNKVKEFFSYYDEDCKVSLNSTTAYLVDCQFYSALENLGMPSKWNSRKFIRWFEQLQKGNDLYNVKIIGDEGNFDNRRMRHIYETLKKIPLRYLLNRGIYSFIIPFPDSYPQFIKIPSYERHVKDVMFLLSEGEVKNKANVAGVMFACKEKNGDIASGTYYIIQRM